MRASYRVLDVEGKVERREMSILKQTVSEV